MSNIIPFSSAKKARAQAAERAGEFLARLDAGAAPDDLERIRAWLAEDPLHRDVFLEAAALWDQLGVLSTLSEVFPLERYAHPAPQPRWRGAWQWVAAASVVLVVGLGWFQRDPAAATPTVPVFPEPEGFVQQFHETAIGEQATITLPDGSEVILNTNTVVEIVYTKTGRNLFLTRGEGLFTVSKDPARPFRVYAGYRLVEAVGTTFTVQHTSPDKVSVVVKEGRVNFLPLHEAMAPQSLTENVDEVLYRELNVPLAAGESGAAVGTQTFSVEKTQIQPDEIEVRLAWTHGMLLFQGTTLEQVLAEVSRYTTTKLEADPAIRDTPVEGYFRAGDIDGLLVAMEKNFHIESARVADDHVLLRAGN